ncbi:MAG: transporter [Comamonas sp.]|nr:transporter [Comamonas sp.]
MTFARKISKIFACLSVIGLTPVYAAEGGSGFYLLGTRSQMAGMSLNPGLYVQNDMYFYSGKSRTNLDVPIAGGAYVGVDAKAYVLLPTIIFVPNTKVADGRLTLNATLPLGYKNVSAFADIPAVGVGAETSSRTTRLGDPTVGASLGWNSGRWNWNIAGLINIPAGDYRRDQLANISYNHWGMDVTGAITWFDPATGWDISGAVGLTFNAKNSVTNYRSGTESHFEAAISKRLPSGLSVGVAGYYYDQLTGDRGGGAILGDYKGRAAALGTVASYDFMLKKQPISLKFKFFSELSTRNRVEGNAAFISISLPLL